MSRRRAPRGTLALLAGAAVATVGVSALVSPLHARAAAATPVAAEGDSYAVGGYVTVAGGNPINIGPVAPSVATAPKPLNPDGLNVATFSCNGSGCILPGVVNSLDVTGDTAKAFVPGVAGAGASVAATECNPSATVLPSGFVTGPLTGGNACSNIAHVEIGGAMGIVADAVSVQSLTQSCTAAPVGAASVVDLFVGGMEIGPLNNGTITPNMTIAIPMVATVILNEQIAENKSAPGPGGTTQSGHGMIVNAVHVIIPTSSVLAPALTADVIIGHAHSDAICGAPVTPLCTPGNTTGNCAGVVITKLPEGLNVVGGQFVASPGQTFSYSIKIANNMACPVTEVFDTLPSGFSFVSAKGALGAPASVSGANNGGQLITWFNGAGWSSPDPLVETITVKIDQNISPGAYVNEVQTLSDCGNNSGSSPPVFVGGPPPATATPTAGGTAIATAAATPTSEVAALITPPNTGAGPDPGLSAGEGAAMLVAGLGSMAAGFGFGRRRRSGLTH